MNDWLRSASDTSAEPLSAATADHPAPETPADETVELTQGLCPDCLARLPARILRRGDTLLLHRDCPRHGPRLSLFEESAGHWLRRERFAKPGTPSRIQTVSGRGCPYDCGLCPAHAQHTCIGLIEVTGRCDLRCRDCYAAGEAGPDLELGRIADMMDFYQDAEFGRAEILQLSGGEPSLHPRILDILDLAQRKGFKQVMLNTNGLRLAREEAFARALGERAGNFEVYLQFDGFDPAAGRALRGEDLAARKQRALDNLARYEVPATLVATVEKGVNDHELGRLVEFAMAHPAVRGVNFQPLALFDAPGDPRAQDRVTLTGLLHRLEQQTGGRLRASDFVPLPCNVHRVAITFCTREPEGFVPITRRVAVEDHLDEIQNTLAFDADDFARRIAGEPGGPCRCLSRLFDVLRPVLGRGYAERTRREQSRHLTRNLFRVSVTSFVDPHNFDLRSAQQECVHVITPDRRRVPFSVYNIFRRRPCRNSPDA